ncbi:MAG: hypothetical protein Fur0041_11330 [Bacteroidia bacterium]
MKWILKGIGFAALFCIFILGMGWVTMLLWNWLMPAIFGITMINFWQAAGLLVLGRLLFGGFNKKCHCGSGREWKQHRYGYWKERWEAKMANMTPEEREKFMAGMNKCGWFGKQPSSHNTGSNIQ